MNVNFIRRRSKLAATGGIVLVFSITAGALFLTHRDSYQPINLRWLGQFDLAQNHADHDVIPDDRLALNGKRVSVKGEMFVPGQPPEGIKQFQLVQDVSGEGPPRVQDRIFAQVPSRSQIVNLTGQMVEIRGTLHVNLERDENGIATSLYRIDVDSFKNLTESKSPVRMLKKLGFVGCAYLLTLVILIVSIAKDWNRPRPQPDR